MFPLSVASRDTVLFVLASTWPYPFPQPYLLFIPFHYSALAPVTTFLSTPGTLPL